jgi:hypothetical protein
MPLVASVSLASAVCEETFSFVVLLGSYRNSKQRREKIEGANLFIFVTLQSCSWRCLVVFSREGRNLQDWSGCYRAIPATSSWWTG